MNKIQINCNQNKERVIRLKFYTHWIEWCNKKLLKEENEKKNMEILFKKIKPTRNQIIDYERKIEYIDDIKEQLEIVIGWHRITCIEITQYTC